MRPDKGDVGYDVVVIGAGFGGLATALSLAERGARVALCERLRYAGGCASTFRRKGFSFEAGATLFSGLAEDQLFGKWIRAHALPVSVEWLDPLVELRSPGLVLEVSSRRQALVETFRRLAGDREADVSRFFAMQRRVADVLWQLFDEPDLLPPFDASSLARHALRSPRYLVLLPLLGRSLAEVLGRHGLGDFAPLRTYLDAVCQITVQASAAEAEAPFALAAMDYFFRGTGHVQGGIGALASALLGAIRACGGDVFLSCAVEGVERDERSDRFLVRTRRGELSARAVVANVLPHAARALLGRRDGELPTLDALARRVETGWGAAMLYAVARAPEGSPSSARHIEIVVDRDAPFIDGNHVFLSISGAADAGRAPPGCRTLTASTHLRLSGLRAMRDEAQAAHIALVHEKMKAAIAQHAPGWWSGITHLETASPRTFERFTGRFGGYVGGIPRRAGLSCYRGMGPTIVTPGFFLVGDTVFPGQSTLGVALGGVRLAQHVASSLRLPAPLRSRPPYGKNM